MADALKRAARQALEAMSGVVDSVIGIDAHHPRQPDSDGYYSEPIHIDEVRAVTEAIADLTSALSHPEPEPQAVQVPQGWGFIPQDASAGGGYVVIAPDLSSALVCEGGDSARHVLALLVRDLLAAPQSPAEDEARGDEPRVEFYTEDPIQSHSMSIAEAARVLAGFFNEFPDGLEEMRASQPMSHGAPQAGEALRPGFAAVPMILTDAMERITGEEGWTWAELLAAAQAITEEEYTLLSRLPGLLSDVESLASQPMSRDERAELERLSTLVNTPTLHSFRDGVVLEAAHQRERWGSEHDAGKTPADWFWLVGYLAGKALHAQVDGNTEKALHHTISTAAALANWHASITGEHTAMRPGIDPAAHGIGSGEGVA